MKGNMGNRKVVTPQSPVVPVTGRVCGRLGGDWRGPSGASKVERPRVTVSS